MEHRIKAPSNKVFLTQEKGGTSQQALNPRKTYTSRVENQNPYSTSNYVIESVENPVTLEKSLKIKDKKEIEQQEIAKEKKRNVARMRKQFKN